VAVARSDVAERAAVDHHAVFGIAKLAQVPGSAPPALKFQRRARIDVDQPSAIALRGVKFRAAGDGERALADSGFASIGVRGGEREFACAPFEQSP